MKGVRPKLLPLRALATKTLLRKPNRGEGIVSTKPRLKSVYDSLGLVYHCFMMCLSCSPALSGPTWSERHSVTFLNAITPFRHLLPIQLFQAKL